MSQISKGFFWSAVERFSIQGISFLLSIIIARIVSPSAFGLIVMIQVFLSFSQLFIDSGFTNALIQKKDRNETDYCTVFIFNMGVAILLYILFFLAAPLIADFYEEPQLKTITRVISLNLIFSSLSIVQKTRLTIDLDFKTQTRAGLIAVVISGVVGVICAYSGMEVWALVIQGLLNQLLISVGLMFYSSWTPKLIFSVESFKRLFSFGSKLMLSNILTNIIININSLVIGKKYTSADLAYYNRGFTLSQFPSVNISDVLNRIIYPVLSNVQDDMNNLRREYLKYLHLSHYVVLPLMGLLIVLADPFVRLVLTPKWIDTVPYLQIFCINFMLYPIIQQTTNPVAALGHSGILLKYQVLKRMVSLGILAYTVTIGIIAICWGTVIGSLFEAVINVIICKKEIGIGIKTHIKSQIDVIIAVVITCLATFFISRISDDMLIQLLIGGTAGVSIYIVLTFILKMREREYIVSALNSARNQFNI